MKVFIKQTAKIDIWVFGMSLLGSGMKKPQGLEQQLKYMLYINNESVKFSNKNFHFSYLRPKLRLNYVEIRCGNLTIFEIYIFNDCEPNNDSSLTNEVNSESL